MANIQACLSSKTDNWATPQDFFDNLNEEFHFTLDPCANEENHKCDLFYTKEQDTHLKDELTSPEAMSGIFMWLVRGYIRYKERGLVMADDLKEVVSKYERDNDLVLQFLESRCDRDENSTIKAKDLYNSFKLWAKSEGAYVLSARKFNSEMERHPEWFDRKSTSSGFVIYWGLKMKEVV